MVIIYNDCYWYITSRYSIPKHFNLLTQHIKYLQYVQYIQYTCSVVFGINYYDKL